MTSWRKWGMRALALVMLFSLCAGPLSAAPRGGHNNGDEKQDLLEPVGGGMLAGDPDGGIGARTQPIAGDFRVRLITFVQNYVRGGAQLALPVMIVSSDFFGANSRLPSMRSNQ